MTNIVTITANDYCHSVFDGTHATPKPCPNGYKLVTSKNITSDGINISDAYFISEQDYFEINKRSKVCQWDILFSMIGTVGNLYLEENSNINYAIKNIGVFSCQNEFKAKWLFYYLQSPMAKNHIKRFLNGAVQKFLSLEQLRNFPILPFEKDKIPIVEILSALDKKIALNKQINARLEEMAKTLYDYWFVQFDFPDANGKPYKSSGGEMVFDETLKREIPKGWEVKKLKDAMQIVRGASPRPIDDFLSNNGIPWIKISDATATSTPFIFKTKEFIKSNGKQYSRYLYPNTLILSNSATPGIPRIVELECCVHDGWLIIENLKNSLFNEFMYFYFLNFKEKIMNLGSGSIFKNLKTEYIKELDLIIPNKETLENAKTIFSDVFKKIKNTQKQNHHLIQLRDFLLPMLMNGQVSVAE